jgi:hypothetical protein
MYALAAACRQLIPGKRASLQFVSVLVSRIVIYAQLPSMLGSEPPSRAKTATPAPKTVPLAQSSIGLPTAASS